MDEDKFNMSLRKFLKQVGVTSQREIERVVRQKGLQQGKLKVFRGRIGQRSDSKKAMVTLAEGQTIDVTTGV